MKVVVCAIAKNEEQYVNEWLRHYLSIGVDHFYIYDNNDERNLIDAIDEQCKPFTTIIPIHGRRDRHVQHRVYEEFYTKYGKEFDWCLFIDLDEFLVGTSDVKKLLQNKAYQPYAQIRVVWQLFGDGGLLRRNEDAALLSTITQPAPFVEGLSTQGKCIVRGNLPGVRCRSAHCLYDRTGHVLRQCMISGRPAGEHTYDLGNLAFNETVRLNHYMTKTLPEFVRQKLNRSDAVFVDKTLALDYFWRLNEKTPEKLAWLKENGYEL